MKHLAWKGAIIGFAIILPSVKVFAENGCRPLTSTKSLSSQFQLNQQEMLSALLQANVKTEHWLTQRSQMLNSEKVIYGPNLDGTYFYRLGQNDFSDRYSIGAKIKKARQDLSANGFPIIESNELEVIGLTNNRARAKAAPNTIRCAKHFPGGSEDLELTESQTVFYSDNDQIASFIHPFKVVINGDNPPQCLMLGHATYTNTPFHQPESEFLGPLIGYQPFNSIPSSLNPGVIKYLRDDLGYKGYTTADWLNMGAVNKWIKTLPANHSEQLLSLYASTYADVDIAPGLRIDTKWARYGPSGISWENLIKEAKSLQPNIYQDWNSKLTNSLYDLFERLGYPMSKQDIERLPFEEKLAIKAARIEDSPCSSRSSSPMNLSQQLCEKLQTIMGGADPWNRSGVLTLLQRQFVTETLLANFKKESLSLGTPHSPEDEIKWFQKLKDNKEFWKTYSSINWDTREVQDVFCHVMHERFQQGTPSPSNRTVDSTILQKVR